MFHDYGQVNTCFFEQMKQILFILFFHIVKLIFIASYVFAFFSDIELFN